MEVRSEQGIMAGMEQFSMGSPRNSMQPQQVAPNVRLGFIPDGAAVYKPVASGSPTYQTAPGAADGVPGGGADDVQPTVAPYGLTMSVGEPVKRKRGRPRKYGTDGAMAFGLAPVSSSPVFTASGSAGFSSPSAGMSSSGVAVKKPRGRPPGSGKKQQMGALGPYGVGFTPHIITVKAGEDLFSSIMSFSHHGPRAVCVLSANGAISNVTLRQAAMSGGTATYEGPFEILSLSGSFLLSESGGQRSRTGGLSVSLAGPDGRILGGGVAGLLTAASPVQVIVGSFLMDRRKESKQASSSEPSAVPVNPASVASPGGGSPPSRGTPTQSSPAPASPLINSSGACNNINLQGFPNMPWN